MRHPAGRVLIRSLLDIRLSRLSMVALGVLSVAATVFILAGGSGRSTAQIAALAALHERPVTVAQAAPASPAPAPTADPSPAAGSSPAGSGSQDSSPASSRAVSPTATGDGVSSSPAPSDSASGSDTSTTNTTTTTSSSTSAAGTLPKVGHIFEIVLSTPSYAAAFGHGSAAPYLRSLEAKGTLLSGYQSLGEGELADELALVGGQAPNADTRTGCTTYTDFPQGAVAKANGTVPGPGCVYPESVLTVGDQVSAAGHAWKAYIGGMGTATCAHPNSGAVDDLTLPGTGAGYDTRHNPFIYFHSLLDLGDCATDDVDLGHLDKALSSRSRTPTYTFVAPGACADAAAVASPTSQGEASTTNTAGTTPTTTTTSTPTTTTTTSTTTTTAPTSSTTTGSSPNAAGPAAGCPADQPVGIAAEDALLKQWVPRILASPAYRADGVLIVAFTGDASTNPGHATRTGALVLSRYARRHRTIATAYGPYSLLRSAEDMLSFSALAHAKSARSFASDVLVAK
ncbi:MAG: hypothetical protein ACXVSE_08405 [Solirubrobacteraceae bacterium]